LEKDRERRYADVAELGLALKEFGGAASSLAAARVGRILGKTPSPTRSEPFIAEPEAEPESEGEHAALSGGGAIPGVPRRGSGWRLGAVVVLLAASGLAAVAVRGVWWPAEAEPLPSASVTALPAAPPSVSVVAEPAAAPSVAAKPRPRPTRSAVVPSAPVVTAPRMPLVPTPVLSSSPPSLYPELRPPPELPPPSVPAPE
jgi:hypothetical protein